MPSSACDWSSDVCSSDRSEEHTSELQSRSDLVCRLLLEKKKKRGPSTKCTTTGSVPRKYPTTTSHSPALQSVQRALSVESPPPSTPRLDRLLRAESGSLS